MEKYITYKVCGVNVNIEIHEDEALAVDMVERYNLTLFMYCGDERVSPEIYDNFDGTVTRLYVSDVTGEVVLEKKYKLVPM